MELWVDDHCEYEPGVVHAHLRHARIPMDPQQGDYLIVGDDEDPPLIAEVLERSASGRLRLRLLFGPPESHAEYHTRKFPAVA